MESATGIALHKAGFKIRQLTAKLITEQTLQDALGHHQAGRLEEAVELYQSVLEADPGHAEANHNMGVLAVQVGQPAGGLS
ncbi:MAG: tetratricopeptide repeat protein, partial [Sulfuritalea sp.]|nr:tetratricopeptide repeat protein [Sulfuritalea sp.]